MSENHIIKSVKYNTKNDVLPIHFHVDHDIIFVVDGSVEITIDNKQIVASKNDMILLSNFESHSTNILKYPYNRYVITISSCAFEDSIKDLALISMLKKRSDDFQNCIHINNFTPVRRAIDRIVYEYNSKPQDAYSEELMVMCIKEILIYAYRELNDEHIFSNSDEDTAKLILHVQQIMERNYSENIRLSEICKTLHISPSYFSQQFKSYTGYSPKQYLTKIRLNHAADKLTTTNATITDIAYDIGFTDANNFHRKFKENFGTTPLLFRKQYRSQFGK